MEIRTIGIDLGKTVFHLVGVNARGEVVVRKKCSRLQLLRFTSNLPACLIGMEACAGSHFLGRALREQGHDVRLMPAQYVKPYVKTNKNDYIDAEACSEANPSGLLRQSYRVKTTLCERDDNFRGRMHKCSGLEDYPPTRLRNPAMDVRP